ncbi:hypothetical protein GCM10022393_32390 [Aquimarina addita]|uniref:DUF1853 family protein n=1 Tax=Aquimarina addita TaxID=870485 RepID=A0ABP6UP07_9FLAO
MNTSNLRKQYIGFLKTHSLWIDKAPFSNFLFDFEIDANAKPIPKIIQINIPDNEVLGKRIEHFFEYYINSVHHYKILLKNKQIFKDKITIGEIDFIIEDHTQQLLIHVELVYKFYLYDPDASAIELQKWVGPNRKDRFIDKIEKLNKKQLPLLHRPETEAVLQKIKIDTKNILQQICFLGNLFVPQSYKGKMLPFINNKCIVGFWIHWQEFIPEDYENALFFIPNKQDWMVDPESNDIWYSFFIITEKIKNNMLQKKATLLWMKSSETLFSKFFIVWW